MLCDEKLTMLYLTEYFPNLFIHTPTLAILINISQASANGTEFGYTSS